MRITGNLHRGRALRTAADHRPTKDQVRLAVFNTLAGRAEDARVIDLFAGSGSIGLEAWSRGASRVDFVENGREAFDALLHNVKALSTPENAHRLRCHRDDALAWLERRAGTADADLIFADPPYAHAREHENWADRVLTLVDQKPLLAPGGVLILELKERQPLHQPERLRPFLDRTYGTTRVVMCEAPAPRPA